MNIGPRAAKLHWNLTLLSNGRSQIPVVYVVTECVRQHRTNKCLSYVFYTLIKPLAQTRGGNMNDLRASTHQKHPSSLLLHGFHMDHSWFIQVHPPFVGGLLCHVVDIHVYTDARATRLEDGQSKAESISPGYMEEKPHQARASLEVRRPIHCRRHSSC